MCDKQRRSVCVCYVGWHALDAVVELSVISIYLFVEWHIKAPSRTILSDFVVFLDLFSRLSTNFFLFQF